MKKKLSCLLAAALLLAGLAGCGEKQQTATESYIAPAVLTDGEKDLLGLLDVPPNRLFECQLGENVDGIAFHIYRLTEGKWTPLTEAGGLSDFSEGSPSGRMALLFDTIPGGVEIAVEGVRFSSGELEETAPTGGATGLVTLSEKKTVENGDEIPLVLQIFAGNAIGSHTVEDFDRPEELAGSGYKAVYAITVTVGK